MKWDDDLLLEDPALPLERGQLQLAMYAVHLSTGHGIYCRQLKLDTIKNYIYNVSTFLSLFSGRDFRKDNPSDKNFGSLLTSVYRDLKSYEGMARRREPYTLQMHAVAAREAATADPSTIIPVLTNGFGAGLNAGFRLSEWAQPSGTWDPSSPQLGLAKEGILTRAIVPADLEIHSLSHRRMIGTEALAIPMHQVSSLFCTWRFQKNGQNGERRLFTFGGDPACPHDPVVCFYGLLRNFQALKFRDPSLQDNFTPLAIYWDTPHSCVKLVTSDEIEAFMRALAVKTYHLDPSLDRKALQLWSAHSLRVGACVLLHAMGFPPQDIKWLLRWLTDAFLAYLRNIAILSQRQNKALDKAAAMPRYY